MRKIVTTTFITLDGVMQAPAGNEEEFAYGGWLFYDEEADKIADKFMVLPFEMLLGRRTYDIFAAFWPHHPEIMPAAQPFNSTKKYVVSHNPFELTWNNSALVTG